MSNNSFEKKQRYFSVSACYTKGMNRRYKTIQDIKNAFSNIIDELATQCDRDIYTKLAILDPDNQIPFEIGEYEFKITSHDGPRYGNNYNFTLTLDCSRQESDREFRDRIEKKNKPKPSRAEKEKQRRYEEFLKLKAEFESEQEI